MRKPVNRLSKKYLIVLVIAFLWLSLLWLCRGFIRDTGARAYANLTYGRQLQQVFVDEFRPVNDQIGSRLGLHLKAADQRPGSLGPPCTTAYFEVFQETVSCGLTDSATVRTTPALLSQWKQQFPVFDRYLTDHGWKNAPQLYSNVPVGELFKKGYTTGIAYEKKSGKNQCGINVYYLTSPQDPGFISDLTVYENCGRDVEFLGGSSNLYSGGWRNLFR